MLVAACQAHTCVQHGHTSLGFNLRRVRFAATPRERIGLVWRLNSPAFIPPEVIQKPLPQRMVCDLVSRPTADLVVAWMLRQSWHRPRVSVATRDVVLVTTTSVTTRAQTRHCLSPRTWWDLCELGTVVEVLAAQAHRLVEAGDRRGAVILTID